MESLIEHLKNWGQKYLVSFILKCAWKLYYLMRRPCYGFDSCWVFTILLLWRHARQTPHQQLVIIASWRQMLVIWGPLQSTHLSKDRLILLTSRGNHWLQICYAFITCEKIMEMKSSQKGSSFPAEVPLIKLIGAAKLQSPMMARKFLC